MTFPIFKEKFGIFLDYTEQSTTTYLKYCKVKLIREIKGVKLNFVLENTSVREQYFISKISNIDNNACSFYTGSESLVQFHGS